MQHTINLVAQKELNDEQAAYCFRCCGDSSTDSWCTLALTLSETAAAETIAIHQSRMANTHEQKASLRNGTHPILAVANRPTTINL